MTELEVEVLRVNRQLERILSQGTASSEVPLRIHSRETDAGGAPELHRDFTRWLGPICNCGRSAVCAPGCHVTQDRSLDHLDACEPACPTHMRFRPSEHRNSPTRLKRALRAVRKLNPHAYDLVYLVAARGWSYEAATARINASNLERGQPEHTSAEFAVLWVSGASMLAASY